MEVLNVQLSLAAYSLLHRTLPRAEQIAGNERGMISVWKFQKFRKQFL